MCAAPPHDVLDAFNIVEAPRRLPGGQGTTYRAGEIILKPVANVVEAEWLAGLSNSIEEAGFRVARPMMSTHGTWIVNGWSASGFVVGEERHGRWNEK